MQLNFYFFFSFKSHYSVKKAAHWLGIGLDNVIIIDSDSHGRMMISDLETKIQISLQENKKPFFVNATSGTTVLGAFDNLNGIADLCEKYNLWMHVDVKYLNLNLKFLTNLYVLFLNITGLSWWKCYFIKKTLSPSRWY